MLAVAALVASGSARAFDPALQLGVIDQDIADDAALVYAAAPAADHSGGGIVDEVRLGGSTFLKGSVPDEEDGVFISGEVLFDPFWAGSGQPLVDILLRPRPHLGASVSAGDGTDQVYAGLTWNLPLGQLVFLEASFGGTVHNGELHQDPGDTNLQLGCRFLFRESAGLGLNLGERWRVMGSVDHSSHASLCDDHNDGLTHVGASLGYRF